MENQPPIVDTGATPITTPEAAPAFDASAPGFAPDPNAGAFVTPTEPKKKNIPALILAFVLVIALGGAGYLFYMYTEANSAKTSLEKKVSGLNTQISDLTAKLAEQEEKAEKEKAEEEKDHSGSGAPATNCTDTNSTDAGCLIEEDTNCADAGTNSTNCFPISNDTNTTDTNTTDKNITEE